MKKDNQPKASQATTTGKGAGTDTTRVTTPATTTGPKAGDPGPAAGEPIGKAGDPGETPEQRPTPPEIDPELFEEDKSLNGHPAMGDDDAGEGEVEDKFALDTYYRYAVKEVTEKVHIRGEGPKQVLKGYRGTGEYLGRHVITAGHARLLNGQVANTREYFFRQGDDLFVDIDVVDDINAPA